MSGLTDLLGMTVDAPEKQYFGGSEDAEKRISGTYGTTAITAQDRQGVQMDPNAGQAYRTAYGDMGVQAGQSREQQLESMGLMRQAALGQAPSAAEAQMARGTDQAINAQMAMANSTRGGGPAMAAAQRQAAFQGAQTQQGMINQAAQLRAQEMAQARGDYMGAASSMRAGDLQTRQQELQALGMSNDQAFRQAQLEMQQRGLNDQRSQAYDQMAFNVQNAQLGADQGHAGMQLQANQANAQATGQLLGAAANAAAGVATGGMSFAAQGAMKGATSAMGGGGAATEGGASEAMNPLSWSDERKKTGIMGARADSFLESLRPHEYSYRDPRDEPTSRPTGGRFLGVMAQDLERAPTGHTLVRDTPEGKAVETHSLVSALAAGAGRLHERVRALEMKGTR